MNYLGDYEIGIQKNRYIVKADEAKQLEKEHINECVYCNELKCCSLSWFYSSIYSELVADDTSIVDDDLIQRAAGLLEYESEINLAIGLADVMEDSASQEDKFMESLVLA
jgi:hypothetical protein